MKALTLIFVMIASTACNHSSEDSAVESQEAAGQSLAQASRAQLWSGINGSLENVSDMTFSGPLADTLIAKSHNSKYLSCNSRTKECRLKDAYWVISDKGEMAISLDFMFTASLANLYNALTPTPGAEGSISVHGLDCTYKKVQNPFNTTSVQIFDAYGCDLDNRMINISKISAFSLDGVAALSLSRYLDKESIGECIQFQRGSFTPGAPTTATPAVNAASCPMTVDAVVASPSTLVFSTFAGEIFKRMSAAHLPGATANRLVDDALTCSKDAQGHASCTITLK